MTLTERRIGETVVLEVAGSIRGAGVDTLLGAIRDQLRNGRRAIVLDFARARSVGLDGLCALLEALGMAQHAGGTLRLAGLTTRMSDLIIVSRLATLFETFDSVDEAVAGCADVGAISSPAPEPFWRRPAVSIQRLLRQA